MEVQKRVLLTELEPEVISENQSTTPTQDQVVSDVPESIGGDPGRVGSETFQSEFSHESDYSDGHFPTTSERGEDFDDAITVDGSRRRQESQCEDILEEDEEDEEDGEEQRGDEDVGPESMGGWEASDEDSEDEEDDEPAQELRDSDYDTDLEMNDDKWLYPDKYDHDTSGLPKYLKACADLGVQPIKYFMKHMQDERLRFRYHGLGPEAIQALAVPLEFNTSIEHLDLEGNWIMAEGTLCLCDVLRENVFLSELNLSENKIENEGAKAVCRLLMENRTIERLDLAGNAIGDSVGEIFHELLTKNTSLKHLNLRFNKLEDKAAAWFKDVLIENETLEHLDLSWNHFQCKGCILLAHGLKENVGLKEMAVAMNGFGAGGGKELGEAIFANRTLLRLDVSYCRLPDSCVHYMSHGLEHNDALQFLDLSYNCFTADGVHVLVEGIQNNESSNLTLLNFGNTRVHDTTDELNQKLKQERDLEVLHGGILEEYLKNHNELDPMYAFKKDPMTKLKEWVAQAGYRLIDLLRHFDRDQSMTISVDEFREGIRSTSIDITEEQIMILVSRLDTDGDGEIDFSELVGGDNEHRKTKRDIDRQIMEKEQKKRERAEEKQREKDRIKAQMMATRKSIIERRESKALLALNSPDIPTPTSDYGAADEENQDDTSTDSDQ